MVRGDKLSKRFIILLGLTLLFVAGSIYLVESKKLEQPILIPSGEQVIYSSSESNEFIVSYITNQKEYEAIQWINIGDIQLYPISYFQTDFFMNTPSTDNLYTKRYTYYDLHEAVFRLPKEQLAQVQNTLKQNEVVTVVLSNGFQIPYTLKLYVDEKNEPEFTFGHVSERTSDFSSVTFSIQQGGTIEELSTSFPMATLKLYKDKEQVTLPYKTVEGEKLSVRLWDNFDTSNFSDHRVFIQGKLDNGKPFYEPISVGAIDLPSNEWINDYVDKVRGKVH